MNKIYFMIPKIIFKYSWIYDQHWKEVYKKDKNYPTEKEILSYIKKLRNCGGKTKKSF